MYKSSAASGLDSKGGDVRYFFRYWKAFSHSSSNLFCYALLMALTKGLHRSMDFLTKLKVSVKLGISFKVVGDFISRIAWIFLGCASIPRWVTRYPKNLHEDTLNVHLVELSFILYFLRIMKVSVRLPI
ncbi:hypothetical protein COP2_045008 [Malus domestica]